MNDLTKKIIECLNKDLLSSIDLGDYNEFKGNLMKFKAYQYHITNFGYVMILETIAMFGIMKLNTIVFTPSEGGNVPFLLIDTMKLGKKNIGFIEFYDCNNKETKHEALVNCSLKYNCLEDYKEKEAWYINRRTFYSLIKGGKNTSESDISNMVVDFIKAYFEDENINKINKDNLIKLKEFKKELLNKGNPSSKVLNKVLKDKSSDFFNNIVMRID